MDRRQRVGGVDLAVHALERDRGRGARRPAHVGSEPRDQPLVVLEPRRAPFPRLVAGELRRAPGSLHVLEVRGTIVLVRRRPRREVGRGAVEHERHRAFGIGRGEEHRHRAALGHPEDHGPLRPHGVHHRAHIVHARLQVRQSVVAHTIGEADAALVEQDQPREPAEAIEEPARRRAPPTSPRRWRASPSRRPCRPVRRRRPGRRCARRRRSCAYRVSGAATQATTRYKPPAVGDTLELVLSGVLERKTRAGNEVLDRRGSPAPPRVRREHSPARRWRPPSRRLLPSIVSTSPVWTPARILEPDRSNRPCDRDRAHGRRCRAVEGREEAVAGGIHLLALGASELRPRRWR